MQKFVEIEDKSVSGARTIIRLDAIVSIKEYGYEDGVAAMIHLNNGNYLKLDEKDLSKVKELLGIGEIYN